MNGPRTTRSGEIIPKERDQIEKLGPGDNLVALVKRMHPAIKDALPRHVTADRIARIAVTAIRTTRDLAICTEASFIGCLLQAAQLGLEVNTPLNHAWLIPRRAKHLPSNVRNCTLIVGYQGHIELAYRSGQLAKIFAYAVRHGDDFRYTLGLRPDIHHNPSEAADREEQPLTHVYAVAAMKGCDPVFEVLSRAQVEARRNRSPSANDGPWVTDYEPMALKSAVRQLKRWLPQSAEQAVLHAIEDAADLGGSQLPAFDPAITEAMVKAGVIEPSDALPNDTSTVSDVELRRAVNGDSADSVPAGDRSA